MSISSAMESRSKLKVVFLGDQSVGKSSIIDRYINNKFANDQQPTVGIDFFGKNISHNNRQFRLQLWDTAGQERFRSLVPSYLRDAACAIFVFDLANQQTILGLTKWMELFQQNRSQNAVGIICGNKKDLNKKFDRSKIQQLFSKYAFPFVEVSAFNGSGVNSLFQTAINELSAKSSLANPCVCAEQGASGTNKPLILPKMQPTFTFLSNENSCKYLNSKSRCC